MTEEYDTPLKPYFLQFVGTYIMVYVVLFLIVYLFKVDKFSAANVVAVLLGGMTVIGSFLKKEARPPNESEKNKLTRGSLLIAIAIELLLGLFVVFGSGTEAIDGIKESGHMGLIAGILAVAVILFLLVDYFILRWIYGSQAKRMFERM